MPTNYYSTVSVKFLNEFRSKLYSYFKSRNIPEYRFKEMRKAMWHGAYVGFVAALKQQGG